MVVRRVLGFYPLDVDRTHLLSPNMSNIPGGGKTAPIKNYWVRNQKQEF
jgi:hypothetical protein